MIEVNLEQGSVEWLAFRRRYRMASETPAILGISPWSSRASIRGFKVSGATPSDNPAMARGRQQEPIARAKYEEITGEIMRPAVFLDGDYGASLDGISLDGKTLIEIKCPFNVSSDRFAMLARSEVAEYDFMQVQHQLMVTNAERCDYLLWNYETQSFSSIRISPDAAAWAKIRSAWDEFWPTVTARDDTDWRALANDYLAAKTALEEATEKLDKAKTALVAARRTDADFGYGVELQKVTRAGSVDWQQVQKKLLAGVDVSPFRGKAISYFQVKT